MLGAPRRAYQYNPRQAPRHCQTMPHYYAPALYYCMIIQCLLNPLYYTLCFVTYNTYLYLHCIKLFYAILFCCTVLSFKILLNECSKKHLFILYMVCKILNNF